MKFNGKSWGSMVIGYVYREDGMHEEGLYFEGTPKNIANFIMSRPECDKTITDCSDNYILDTYGYFINHCDDKELLEKVKKILIPMQMEGEEPKAVKYFDAGGNAIEMKKTKTIKKGRHL